MEKLTATFKVITPLFLGGAEPDREAELRPPAFKAALRFWYRVLDRNYQENEARIFGGTGKNEGQALFLLRVRPKLRNNTQWNPGNLPGLKYLSFPLRMDRNDRRYIDAGKNMTLELTFKRNLGTNDRKRILASLWLLGHLGGLGARSRRGFGTIALQEWEVSHEVFWPELSELPLAHDGSDVSAWIKHFEKGLQCLKAWFPKSPNPDHTVLGTNTTFRLIGRSGRSPYSDWRQALDAAGTAMQKFRNRWDTSNPASDYHRVKAHICVINENAATVGVGLKPPVAAVSLSASPERTAFGLPLTFRYSSLEYELEKNGRTISDKPEVTFEGLDGKERRDRNASPIHIRVVKIGGYYYPLYIRLDAPFLKIGDRVKKKRGNLSVGAPNGKILDQLWSQLPPGRDITWSSLK